MTDTTDTSSADFDRQVEAVLTQGKAMLGRKTASIDDDTDDAMLIKSLNAVYNRLDRQWKKQHTKFVVRSYEVD